MKLSDLTDEQLDDLAKYRLAQTRYYYGLALDHRRHGAGHGERLREVQAEMMRRKRWLPEKVPGD